MELVEREGVLTELGAMLGEVGQGNGRLALVSGEAGIGKSAVVERFCRDRSDGVRVLAGGCDPLATPRPLAPLADIAAGVGGELDRLLDEGTDPTPLFHTFVRVLSGSRRPTVVVLEDMHWADQATIDLLCFLGRRVAQTRALVVVTFRDDELEADHPLRVAVGNLPVAPVVRRLPLERLSRDGVAALALGKRLDPGRLFRLSGGNPFFLTELLATEEGELPATVRDAVLARVSRLSEPARAAIDVLAAVGRPVARPLLQELEIADGSVDEGVSRGLLRWEQRRIAFRHELARTAVLDAIPPARAAGIHGLILAALLEAEEARDAAELAYHAEEAGEGAIVLEFAPAAALAAERLSAHREAAAQWARALRFARELPAGQRADLYRAHSREAHQSGDVEAALASAKEELELRRTLGNPLAIGRALYWLCLLVWATDEYANALPLAYQSIDVLASEPPSAELATAYVTVAGLHAAAAQASEACFYAREASTLADRLGLVDVQVRALRVLGVTKLCGPDEDGWPELEQALELALAAEDLRSETAVAFDTLVWFGAMHRQFDRFDAFFSDGLAFCERHELVRWRWCLLQRRCVELLHRGRWTEAGDLAQSLLGQLGSALVERIQPLYVLGRLRARRGDPQAWEALDEALELAAPRNELQHIGNVCVVRAEAAWLEGDHERMVAEAQAAYPLAVPVRDPWILGEFALWLWRGGALEDFDPVLEQHPYGLQIQGDWEAAAAAWERLGCPFEQAAALLDGDEAALRRAHQIFDGLGARPAVSMAARRLRALGVRGVPRGAQRATRESPYNLTRRQQEILSLLEEGLSDAEIADRLFLSTKTVNHHVSAVLAKLGVRSRVEAIAREK